MTEAKSQEAKPPELTQAGPGKKKVRTWRFDIPPKARVRDEDPTKVVLRELDPGDFDLARKNAHGDRDRVSNEAVILSLHAVDGRPVDHAIDEGTFHWNRWGPKVRHLLQLGWAKIHVTEDDEDDAFLSSMKAD